MKKDALTRSWGPPVPEEMCEIYSSIELSGISAHGGSTIAVRATTMSEAWAVYVTIREEHQKAIKDADKEHGNNPRN